jgi:hypothetical protein
MVAVGIKEVERKGISHHSSEELSQYCEVGAQAGIKSGTATARVQHLTVLECRELNLNLVEISKPIFLMVFLVSSNKFQ